MYQVKVNGGETLEISIGNGEISVNGSPVTIDRVAVGEHTSHVLYGQRSYTVEVEALDAAEKTATIKVNGRSYVVAIRDRFDQLLKQLGMESLGANKIQQIKAPMPGLVLSVLVKEGDEVKKGDNLLVLEAMKMENMIKSPGDGVIKQVGVKQGDKVEKNELLIGF